MFSTVPLTCRSLRAFTLLIFPLMANKSLKRIELGSCIIDRLKSRNIHTCEDLLKKHPFELGHILGKSHTDIEATLKKVSHFCSPRSATVLSLWNHRRNIGNYFLATSLDLLDGVLHGGIPTGTITEIAGPSGCGKTQFSMMLSVITTLPEEYKGLNGAVIYIDTESAFSAERLVEIAENRYPDVYSTEKSLENLATKVHVYIESTCASLLHRLESLEEDIITFGVKMIVLDSVASLIRKEFDSRTSQNIAERTKLLSKQAALLKYIAETFNIAVVVTNQITTRYGNERNVNVASSYLETDELNIDKNVSLDGEGSYVTAALGNTWSHCVNTRLIVQYLDGPRRQVLVAKSPVAPFANFVYIIQASGIELEKGGADHYDGTDPGLQRIRVRTSIPQCAFMY